MPKKMKPEQAVLELCTILKASPTASENEIYLALSQAGVPEPLADRTYKFTQIAWGRILLHDLGITFSDEYICFNANGDVTETGQLRQEPSFAAASHYEQSVAGSEAFKRLAVAA